MQKIAKKNSDKFQRVCASVPIIHISTDQVNEYIHKYHKKTCYVDTDDVSIVVCADSNMLYPHNCYVIITDKDILIDVTPAEMYGDDCLFFDIYNTPGAKSKIFEMTDIER